jgi:hypothetical protein
MKPSLTKTIVLAQMFRFIVKLSPPGLLVCRAIVAFTQIANSYRIEI